MKLCDECHQEYPDNELQDCPCRDLRFGDRRVVTRSGIKTIPEFHGDKYQCCKYCFPIKHNHSPDDAWI